MRFDKAACRASRAVRIAARKNRLDQQARQALKSRVHGLERYPHHLGRKEAIPLAVDELMSSRPDLDDELENAPT